MISQPEIAPQTYDSEDDAGNTKDTSEDNGSRIVIDPAVVAKRHELVDKASDEQTTYVSACLTKEVVFEPFVPVDVADTVPSPFLPFTLLIVLLRLSDVTDSLICLTTKSYATVLVAAQVASIQGDSIRYSMSCAGVVSGLSAEGAWLLLAIRQAFAPGGLLVRELLGQHEDSGDAIRLAVCFIHSLCKASTQTRRIVPDGVASKADITMGLGAVSEDSSIRTRVTCV